MKKRMAEKAKQPRRRTLKERAVIDRIEDGEIAVVIVEDKEQSQIDLHVSRLPADARDDGDHLLLTFEFGSDDKTRTLKKIEAAPQSRAAAEERVTSLQQRLEKLSGTAGQKDFKL
ncbi:MAG: DUF3006 domain-containing protein [Acidobacteria bacterium]|nr:DUF3006 domain-containing protein [Acidobacteriota bacterium]